jgi:hypothetical protein
LNSGAAIWVPFLQQEKLCQIFFNLLLGQQKEPSEQDMKRTVVLLGRVEGVVRSTSEIDKRPHVQDHFRKWLLGVYGKLVANGDISPIKGEEKQVKYMRALFNRSSGEIKNIEIGEEAGKGPRPGDIGYGELWKENEVHVESK